MARQRLRGESAPPQTVEQEARFAGVTKRRYQQVLQATREELGLAPHPCSKRITFKHTFQLERPEPKTKTKKVTKPKPRNPKPRKPRVPTKTVEERIESRRAYDQGRNQQSERKEFQRLQKQKARRERKAAGLCKTCPNPAIPGQTKCEVCREKHNRNR